MATCVPSLSLSAYTAYYSMTFNIGDDDDDDDDDHAIVKVTW
jgi:hypothetical protein